MGAERIEKEEGMDKEKTYKKAVNNEYVVDMNKIIRKKI